MQALKLSGRQADDRLLRLQFAIMIALGNLRSCCGENYVPMLVLRFRIGPYARYLAQDFRS